MRRHSKLHSRLSRQRHVSGETERASERVQQRVDQRIDPPAEDVDWQGPNEPMLPQNTIEEPEPEECEAGVVLQSI